MKPVLRSSLLIFLLYTAGAHAQMYKWVGSDGKITYSDTPPPSTAKQVERKNLQEGGISVADLPFELAEAVRNNPVTLYTTANCGPCDLARNLLNRRGIPFKEKTVASAEDIAKLHDAGGQSQLPFMTVGRSKQQGFESGAWNSALSAAGYPETSILPRSYHAPQAEAASPKAVPKTAAREPEKQAEEKRPDDLPPATGDAPPGFRF
jgi:glutaredoxin